MINFKEDEYLHNLNHSCAHMLAQAVKHLYPDAKFWVGPVIEEGFYYDMDLGDKVITEEDIEAISKEMKKLAKDGKRIVRHEISREEALEMFKDDPYKIDLINNMPEGEVISCYTQGDFTDLCRGGHVDTLKECKNFKLLKFSGAYWKGDSNNKMLQRIYGVCLPTPEELEEHLKELEEAKERDHRKIGKDQNLFFTHQLVGAGLPLFTPNGATIRRILERYIQDKEIKQGYKHVYSPVLATTEMYKISGHWDHYKEDMFPIMHMDNEELVLRPMNCPHHALIFKNEFHSYRDLPVRIGELANVFRYEASGAVLGLERVRQICQNDAHLFVRPDQIAEEVGKVINLIFDVYINDFGFSKDSFKFRLSKRSKEKEKYIDNDEMWETAETQLKQIMDELKLEYYEAEGEAAFYGPKIDIQIKTALGHDLTIPTCQLDFSLAERFDLTYVDENGNKVRPVVIHRAILGSSERFMSFLLEETKGILPLWLAPVQVNIIPVKNEYHLEYSKELKELLFNNGIRVELDDREEKLGYRLRESVMRKIPLTLVIGDKERDNKTISFRRYGSEETTTLSQNEFIELIKKEVSEKK